jgi:NAD(P)-dependent dehydrogenase (short-subunit alcohol dehydrogenase family)
MSLEGKVAVVTGASRGIGRAIALRLARDGALVCVNYRGNAEAAKAAVDEIEAAGGAAFALQADVGSVAELGRFFAALDGELEARRGDRRFDILVNNAGVTARATTSEATEADFDRLFATNVKGPFFTAQQAIPRLRNGGRVINVSSNLSRRPMPMAAAYCMTKAAIDAFTVALAAELGPRGITVNTLAPGLTATDMNAAYRSDPNVERAVSSMTALGRIGRVEDVADAVALLASPDAAWVTGEYLGATGGLGLVMPGFGPDRRRDS